jgi:hypothetical protein
MQRDVAEQVLERKAPKFSARRLFGAPQWPVPEQTIRTTPTPAAIALLQKAGRKPEPRGAIEMIGSTDILDVISHVPGSSLVGLNDIRRKIYEDAKRKLKSRDYGPTRKHAMTPMGGFMTVRAPQSRDDLVRLIKEYEAQQVRGDNLLAGILGGIADLPSYMAEMAAGGIGKVKSVPAAFSFAAKILPIQFGRLDDALSTQVATGERGYKAVLKALGDQYIENLSETSGKAVGVVLGKLPFMGKVTSAMRQYARNTLGWTDDQFWKTIGTKVGWDGFIGEWAEEDVGNTLRAIFKVHDFDAGKDAGLEERFWAGLTYDYQHLNRALTRAGVLAAPSMLGVAGRTLSPRAPEERPGQEPEIAPEPHPQARDGEPTTTISPQPGTIQTTAAPGLGLQATPETTKQVAQRQQKEMIATAEEAGIRVPKHPRVTRMRRKIAEAAPEIADRIGLPDNMKRLQDPERGRCRPSKGYPGRDP